MAKPKRKPRPGCVVQTKTIRTRDGRVKTFKVRVGDDCPKRRKPNVAHLRPYQFQKKT
jgi:hypothetical protein